MARSLLWLTIILAGAGICMAGCGQKGPLYLPDEMASRVAFLEKVRNPPSPRLIQFDGAPSALGEILDRALAIAPEDRFPSAAAFARAINRLLPAHLVSDPPQRWHPAAGVAVPATTARLLGR